MSLRRNGWYSALSMFFRLGLSVAVIPLLIRSMGLAQYGIFAILTTLLGISSLLQFGLDFAASYYLAEAASRSDARAQTSVITTSLILFSAFGIVVACVIALSRPWLSPLLFPTESDNPSVPTALLLFGGVAGVQYGKYWAMAVEAGLLRYDLQAQGEAVAAIVLYGGLVCVAVLGGSMIALATWYLIATLLALLIHYWVLRQVLGSGLGLRWVWDWTQSRLLLRFGLTQWLAQMGGMLFGQIDRLVINWLLGLEAAGLYVVVTSVTSKINQFSAAAIQTIAPAMSRTSARMTRKDMAELFLRAQLSCNCIIFVLVAALIVSASPLAALLVSDAHSALLASLLRVMAFLYGVYSLNAAGFFAAVGMGRPTINALWVFASGVLFVLLLFVLTANFGLVGAAWANIGYALTVAINWQVSRLLDISPRAFLGIIVPTIGSLLLFWCASAALQKAETPAWIQGAVLVAFALCLTYWVGGSTLITEARRLATSIATLCRAPSLKGRVGK